MSRTIANKFHQLKDLRRTALVPYLTAGYPSLSSFVRLAAQIEDAGADLLEIGIPHSDPLADGPTIRHTSHLALSNGLTVADSFRMIDKLAAKSSMPLIVMCYYNTVLHPGLDRFAGWCSESGVSGLIVPDLPLEEGTKVSALMSRYGIETIFLAAPTTPLSRIKDIASICNGFLYLVSVTGITGARRNLPRQTTKFVRKAKSIAGMPICVGFGISNAEIARKMGRISDGVIVGSALLDRIRKAKDHGSAERAASKFIGQLRRGLDG